MKHVIRFLLLTIGIASAGAVELLPGFSQRQIASSLVAPTAMTVAPDGRIFVCEQPGRVRVIKNGTLLPAPFVSLQTDVRGERGLLGIALDPSFPLLPFVYVYYTVPGEPAHNRVSRFIAAGDVAVPGSEQVLLELNELGAQQHNAGALKFGLDGKLYIAAGDNHVGSNSQSLTTLLGKILRINRDGSIPTDNPFYDQANGVNKAIWAMGLRNPFSFDVQPGTGRMFINDVGFASWEEINEGHRGGNYGWPQHEGAANQPPFLDPLFQYQHGFSDTTGCSIVGAAFYGARTLQFPAAYWGHYFFADYCSGWIRQLKPSTGEVRLFARDLPSPVDLEVGPDGTLYCLTRGTIFTESDPNGAVFAIRYAPRDPAEITSHPTSRIVSVGQRAVFTVEAAGTGPLSYQWQRNGINLPNATAPSYTIPSATLEDGLKNYRCRVSNEFATVFSRPATLFVTTQPPPAAAIVVPAADSRFIAGQRLVYLGYAEDERDGKLPGSAFSWRVDFHHDQHSHPFLPLIPHQQGGSFVIPNLGETATNVWYRIYMTATNSAGLQTTVTRDILPVKSRVTVATQPAGLQVMVDFKTAVAPYQFESVAGMVRTFATTSPQSLNGKTYEFVSWSNNMPMAHNAQVPVTDWTLTAVFREVRAGVE